MEAVAKLNNEPTSPRKMRLLVDLVRGMKVEKALAVLEHNPNHNFKSHPHLFQVRHYGKTIFSIFKNEVVGEDSVTEDVEP